MIAIEEQTIRIRVLDVFVKTIGQGVPIVFLHGGYYNISCASGPATTRCARLACCAACFTTLLMLRNGHP